MKKSIYRSLAILIVLAMLLPCISMTAFSQDIPCVEDGCSGHYSNGVCTKDAGHFEAAPKESNVYKISNAGQLYWFAALVNAGESEHEGDKGPVYNAALTADITIPEGLSWTPIGLYTGANDYVRYSGTFDGAGHAIYGLSYDNTAYTGRNAAFIGILDNNGTVRDLTIAESSINGATDIGGIVSHNYGTVSGCTNEASVTGTGATGGIVCRNMKRGVVENCVNNGVITGATTGGIVAENSDGAEVLGCVNTGAVSGTNSVGGIVGLNSGAVEASRNEADVTASGTHVGGVVGNHIGGGINACGNQGDVTGASDYVGGVAGVCLGATITESFNSGAVTGVANSEAVGGVAGAIDGTNLDKAKLEDCYNTGTVNGRGWVGGIAGVSGYQKTPQAVEIKTSFNTGVVSGTTRAGAVVGRLSKGTVSGVYYLQGSGQNTVSGATSATSAKFASGELAYKLNGSTSAGEPVWKQTIGVDAHPNFDGAVVFYDSAKGTYYNDLCQHSFGEWTVTKEATCTAAGVEERTCSACGEVETNEIPALGHDFVNGDCTRCDAVMDATFTDVPVGSYCFDAVEWAVEKGVTNGVSETLFNPNGKCMRAHVVTFLWRAAGSPEPSTTETKFVDVEAGSFYEKAVLWAVENGITTGVDETHFAPSQNCSRAQVVTFLWRAKGEIKPTTQENPFNDVPAGSYCYDAVLWAVENGITNGVAENTFGPNALCTRAQVVTFLYRAE